MTGQDMKEILIKKGSTNGYVLQATFPSARCTQDEDGFWIFELNNILKEFTDGWWSAKYVTDDKEIHKLIGEIEQELKRRLTMVNIDFGRFLSDIKYYPYRKAHIVDPILEIEENEEVANYRAMLCEKVGVDPDNHTCFVIDGTPLEFSDRYMLVGGILVED